ncbi:phosphate ABC transporter substrate-binding protein PstS family protein [Corynebacterium aquatimens]|uniref:Phosphate-binding protein n=1 Tax=Corynebacterium aquatimens TaxID=1190508 RepID=A0A931E256_9CORY|nr:phosphate ABC transporter substrate-binding protein PstS family protein [Corynebacterium aquatimens]MBG6122873.1 phosphate transport system substrate-binding protein [Corynebacterium aquatimens]WJY66792.1 Phosphate-binding protein PstS precursor [Corynebacterium aquatimens]
MKRTLVKVAAPVAALALLAGCANQTESGSSDAGNAESDGAKQIVATGSATVEPISRYIAERYNHDVSIEGIGSTDGFEKFCAGEADINDSSVPIPGAGEPVDFQKKCADGNVEYIELPIALDAITIVKNSRNDWANDLTLDDLKKIWSTDSSVTKWSDINPEWPDEEITLYGREAGSGTRGVFLTTVLGDAELRDDVKETDDIQELSKWVAEDEYGLSFMGIGNYLATEGEVRDHIDNVTVDGIAPSLENTRDGSYPLARPLFIYVNKSATDRAEVDSYVRDYLDKVETILPRVYFYPLPQEEYPASAKRYADRVTGPDTRWNN